MRNPNLILPTIVVSQFFCTSLWFAGNAVMNDLIYNFHFDENALGYLTSTVQFGFILGTLIFAFLSIADRFSPSKVFFTCALLGGISNLCVIADNNTFTSILFFRFLTGFFLAGIYPVGMKIAADYYQKGLGKSLGFLVGALVLGTAFPHLLKNMKGTLPWEFVLISTSSLAFIGGILMLLLVGDGPFRKPSQKLQLMALVKIFSKPNFRAASFGYFGHMWELYTFWAFVPILLKMYLLGHPLNDFNISLLSFIIIGVGSLACIIAGYLALQYGTKKIASLALSISGFCCLLFPFVISISSPSIFIVFLLIWGMSVIADSPLFSTLVAQNAPLELKGTALTIVNSIGFFLTIISIQVIDILYTQFHSPFVFSILAIGPIVGLYSMNKLR